jgi:hypothetical protein
MNSQYLFKNLRVLFLVGGLFGSLLSHAGGAKSRERISRVLQSNSLASGAFYGESMDSSRTQYHLSVQDMPLRKGSFFGVIVQLGSSENPKKNIISTQVAAYVIDPIAPNMYMMTPLTMNETNISLWDDRPTLQLQISRDRLIVSKVEGEGAPNPAEAAGFLSTIGFEYDSNFRLSSPNDGLYGKSTKSKNTQLAMTNSGQMVDSVLNLSNLTLNGTYSARSYLDAIATLRGTKVSVYGTQEESRPRAIYVNLQIVTGGTKVVSDNVLVFTLTNRGPGNGYLLPRIAQ